MIVYKNIFIVFLLLLSSTLFSQEKGIVLQDHFKGEKILGANSLSYLENTKNQKINPDTLLKASLKLQKSAVPNFGFITHDVYYRSKVKNNSGQNKTFYLTLSNPNLDLAELYLFRSGKRISFQKYSDLTSIRNRPFEARRPVFLIELEAHQELQFVLKVNNGGEQFHFDLKISDQIGFERRENKETYFLGIFIGILLFIIILNFYLWIMTKDSMSMYYCFYLVALLLLQLSLLGFGKLYIWENSSYLTNHANPVFASVSVFFLLMFARRYLNLSEVLPKMDTYFKYFSIPILITIALSVIPTDLTYRISIVAINIITLVLNIVILPVAWKVFVKGYRPAFLFLLAFLILVISVFGFILKNFGVIPSSFLTDFGFQIGSTAEVLLFSMGLIIRFRKVQKEAISQLEEINFLKEKANEELEKKVVERTKEIEEQKIEIEEKNREIVSSFTYARRIQEAILPDTEKVNRILPSTYIFYQPKEIISGDFYWIEEKIFASNYYRLFAVIDCTGHGVPGAMMSVLCHAVLNRCLEEISTPDPAHFLELANKYLTHELSKNQQVINDGMDISLCILNSEKGELIWAGANNPLWIQRGEELIEFEAVRRPIGMGGSDSPFILQKILLQKNDRILLFSDGLTDQFGSLTEKKIRKKLLREWIYICRELPADTLVNFIGDKFNDWKGTSEQTDDVSLLVTVHQEDPPENSKNE